MQLLSDWLVYLPIASGRRLRFILFPRAVACEWYNDTGWYWNTSLPFLIHSHYPLNHPHSQAYTTCHSKELIHLVMGILSKRYESNLPAHRYVVNRKTDWIPKSCWSTSLLQKKTTYCEKIFFLVRYISKETWLPKGFITCDWLWLNLFILFSKSISMIKHEIY